MVDSQIANLTPDLSLSHNLCFNHPNGSCKPILNIYVPWDFQWYKELHNPMGFDLYNRFLKLQESIWTPIPKVGAHLGVWRFIPSQSPTLLGTWDVTLRLPSWLAHLVTTPRLGLQHICFACVITMVPHPNVNIHFLASNSTCRRRFWMPPSLPWLIWR